MLSVCVVSLSVDVRVTGSTQLHCQICSVPKYMSLCRLLKTLCWMYNCSEHSSMCLLAVNSVMLAVSQQITGPDMKNSKDTGTAVVVVSRLLVGRLRDHVSIPVESKSFLYSRIERYRYCGPICNQFILCWTFLS